MNIENYIKNRENPFECLSAEARYWIGYILADGHLVFNERRRAYSISLFSINEPIILKFKEFIGPRARLYKRPSGIYQVIYNSKPVTKWFMDTFGVPENKSLTLNPTIDLDWDIIHGYFDGDGSIRMTLYKNRWKRYEASICSGSKIWLERLSEFMKRFNIHTTISHNSENAYNLHIRSKNNVYLLYKNMYANNTSTLMYKYNQFVALFGDE